MTLKGVVYYLTMSPVNALPVAKTALMLSMLVVSVLTTATRRALSQIPHSIIIILVVRCQLLVDRHVNWYS